MIRIFLAIIIFSNLIIPFQAISWTYFLQDDLGVRGLMRYCRYNNGKIYTFNATELCPMTIEDSAPGFGEGVGFLVGEYQDGMTKVCIYEVLGERKALRLPLTSLCPLNARF